MLSKKNLVNILLILVILSLFQYFEIWKFYPVYGGELFQIGNILAIIIIV